MKHIPDSQQSPSPVLLTRVLCVVFFGQLLFAISLTLWQTALVGHPSDGLVTLLSSFLPSLTQTVRFSDILQSKALIFNGLVFLLSIGLSKPSDYDHKQATSLGLVSALWNGLILLDFLQLSIISDSASVLQISQLLNIYPSEQSITAALLHCTSLIVWLFLFFNLQEALNKGSLHFRPDVYQFLNLAHATFGGALILSFVNSEAIAPLIQSETHRFTVHWAENYFTKASMSFALIGAFYHIPLLPASNTRFMSLAFSHWFSLFLGLSLVYLGSTLLRTSQDETDSVRHFTLIFLGVMWVSHLLYCYFGQRELWDQQPATFSEKSLLRFALASLSVGILLLANNLVPTTFSHEVTSAWVLSDSLFTMAALLLTCFLMMQFRKHLTPRYTPGLAPSGLGSLQAVGLVLGSLICILAAIASLLVQHRIEVNALSNGTIIEFHEIKGSLQSTLVAYLFGTACIFFSTLLQFFHLLYAAIKVPRKPHRFDTPQRQNSVYASSPVQGQNQQGAIEI